jgi:hypothetical protein
MGSRGCRVTTKEIPKRELRVEELDTHERLARHGVTTKEIPKRELREHSTVAGFPTCQRQVTTKEIPKRELRVALLVKSEPVVPDNMVTTKEIPKRELRDSSARQGISNPRRFWLQQKKSQKGN